MAWDRDKERKAAGSYRIGISIFALMFAIFWCCAAAAMGAQIMLIFGIPFVGFMIFQLVISIKIMKQEKQKNEEPWDYHDTAPEPPQSNPTGSSGGYCPYCGAGITDSFQFCPKCGRRLS